MATSGGDSPDSLRTVTDRGRAEFEIRGSEFLGQVAPAESQAAAETFVAEVRETYDDATHNVPAYRVRAGAGTGDEGDRTGMLREWSSDDGEPTGSAGKPALNVLQQEGVENVVAVVTRYYGGTNLGVGGLARAYSRGVTDALADAGIVEREPRERFAVVVDYDDSGTVRSILESVADCAFDAEYEERVRFDVGIPMSAGEQLRDRLRSATSGRADISTSV